MVAITNGLFIEVLPSVSNFTRSLDCSSRSKYSTIWFQEASLRSSPGTKPSTSSGAGMAADIDVPCDVVSDTVDTRETKSNSDTMVRRISFSREVELEDRKQFSESILIRERVRLRINVVS